MISLLTETLRKFPVLPILDRVAGRDFVIPGTNVTIQKGTTVYIPLLGLHMDPDVFPDPDHYDPERFNEENRKARHPFMYLPFGEGPKYCIGRYCVLCCYRGSPLEMVLSTVLVGVMLYLCFIY